MTAVFARDAWRPLFFIASCGLVGCGFLRYEVTEGGTDCKRPPPAWLHEKIRQPSAICAKSGIPYFFICHACITSPFPPCRMYRRNTPDERSQMASNKREEIKTMRRSKQNISIKEIKVLGSYAKMYKDSEVYAHSLRKLSKDVKKNDSTAIAIAALLLSQILSPNAVLIPVPQSCGKADYTLELANTIRIIRQDCEVIDILSGRTRKKLYDIKKTRTSLKGVKTGMKVKEDADCMETLASHSDIYLLDNVLNTGFTFSRARKALRKYVKVEPSLLAISATSNWLK